jgi:hypothetical protein
VFRSHDIEGEFRGKTAQKARGEVDLTFGEPAPAPDEPDYPGNTDEYQCVVEHEWTAKRR